MTVTLLSVSARGGGEEIALSFEIRNEEHSQKEILTVSAADFAELRLTKGEVSFEIFDETAAAARLHSARKKALGILSYGRCSRRRMVQKLRAKGVERETAEAVSLRLAEEGYLDEESDALREAERDLGKLWGERRIAADLRAKGYEADTIREVMLRLEDDGTDYAELCAKRIERTLGAMPEEPRARQKAIAALQRVGFSLSDIREAVTLLRNRG